MRADSGPVKPRVKVKPAAKPAPFLAGAVKAVEQAVKQPKASGSGKATVGTQKPVKVRPVAKPAAKPVRASGSGAANVGVKSPRMTGVTGSGKAKTTGGVTLPLATVDSLLAGRTTAGVVRAAGNAAAGAERVLSKAPLAAAPLISAAAIPSHLRALGLQHIGENAARDLVDIPASTVPSVYLVGKTAAEGHLGKAGKMLAQPAIDTAEHPLKSFEKHPIGTVLIAQGLVRGAGRGVGGVLRHAPSETLRRVGSTAREPLTVPGGVIRQVNRRYSKDVVAKAAQVAVDRRRARKNTQAGRQPQQASPRQVARMVSEDVQAAKNVTQIHQGVVQHAARKAVGRKATAATNLVAQGITTASEADLRAYLGELERSAAKLTGESLARNEHTRALIQKALKSRLRSHNPARVEASATAASDLLRGLEQQVKDRGIVSPTEAEATSLAGVKARRVGKGTKSPAISAARVVRRKANRENEQAIKARRSAQAEFNTVKEAAQAAAKRNRGGVPPVEADAVRAALAKLDAATERAKTTQAAAHDASMQYTRAHVPVGTVEPAYVSHAPGGDVKPAALPSKPPRVRVQQARAGEAVKQGTLNAHPRALVQQAVDLQRRVDAFDARQRFVDGYAHRVGGKVQEFGRDSAGTAARRLGDQTGVKWEPLQRQTGDRYVLVPKDAADRLRAHEQQPAQNQVLKAATAQWRKNVLAFSPRWLTGNVLEAALRATVAGAGPGSYLVAKRTLNRLTPAEREQALARTVGGGNFRTAQNLTQDSALVGDLSGMAKALHNLAKVPNAVGFGHLYRAYTGLMFNLVNSRVENAFQTAMLGKAIRSSPLMDHRLIRVSAKAAEEAARGLKNTDTQVEMGRLVDDMYGRYQKFGPDLRNTISTYTPFAAWAINATKFLYVVLPRDHPVLTALLASANQASEGWRKQHGLFADPLGKTAGQVPTWLLGSIPVGAGGHQRAPSRYTPFAVTANETMSPLGVIPDMLMPQLSEAMQNLRGKNWQGKPLSSNPSAARDVLAAAVSLLGGQAPLAAQATAVAGARLPNMPDSQKIDASMTTRARKTFDPFIATSPRVVAKGAGLPAGVSQHEIDRLVQSAKAAGPAVSQAEIDRLLKQANGGK